MHNHRLFLLLSALCYTIPFVAPYAFWWLIFFFPPFLFFAVRSHSLFWFEYAAWALLTTIVHIIPLCDAVLYMTSGSLFLRLIPALLLIIYVATYPTIWLLLTRAVLSKWHHSFIQTIGIWTASLWLYLAFMNSALFWLFGRCEGYVFCNPLLPITTHPQLILYLHWFALPIGLLVYCFTTSAMTVVAARPSLASTSLFILSLLPWFGPLLIQPPQLKPPEWLCQIGHLPFLLPKSVSCEQGTALIAHELRKLAKHNPQLRLVILPESAWNGLPLNSVCAISEFENHTVPHILIGSFAQEGADHFNSMYWFHNGSLARRIDKQHAVPFIERIPYGATMLCNSLFFKKSKPLCTAHTTRPRISIDTAPELTPMICSELFCHQTPCDTAHTPILAICNDWWFRLPHFQKLMALTARLRAIQWDRPVLYLSFRYAQFFDQHGNTYPVGTTPAFRFLK